MKPPEFLGYSINLVVYSGTSANWSVRKVVTFIVQLIYLQKIHSGT